ncbi:uncharacterized protein [Montipora capricornis]|uniref:uncharacterized protein isoform X4 n=1 Tax=Montipora capricornis TaxID=246305 RepID=UPI0035F1C65A
MAQLKTSSITPMPCASFEWTGSGGLKACPGTTEEDSRVNLELCNTILLDAKNPLWGLSGGRCWPGYSVQNKGQEAHKQHYVFFKEAKCLPTAGQLKEKSMQRKSRGTKWQCTN